MAKLSIGDKAQRVLVFLLGLRHRRARRALAAHGFTDEEIATGWLRLQQLAKTRLDHLTAVLDPRLLGELDAWENQWFPIAEVVLRTNFPNVHSFVFRNLGQTEGAEVVVSVTTLLDRLVVIAKPRAEGGLGDEGGAARALLDKRGVNARVVGEARELLAQIGTFEPEEPEEDGEDDAEAIELAEQNLWNWYLEWSSIARVAIRDRRLLRSLGFLRTVRRADGDEAEEVVTDEELETESPAPVSGPTPAQP